MPLFKVGEFTSAAGLRLPWKVDCDALTDEDWQGVAVMVSTRFTFGLVEGVPTGGNKFAKAMEQYINGWSTELLIVDDVLTTGQSMERHRAGREAFGIVLFARGICPNWVLPVWSLSHHTF